MNQEQIEFARKLAAAIRENVFGMYRDQIADNIEKALDVEEQRIKA